MVVFSRVDDCNRFKMSERELGSLLYLSSGPYLSTRYLPSEHGASATTGDLTTRYLPTYLVDVTVEWASPS